MATGTKKKGVSISDILKERQHEPDRILVYGVEKIGKSSFGAAAPNPIFIAAEAGVGHLEADHFPQPTTFDEVLDCIKALGNEKSKYQTLVIDPIGWVDHLIRDQVCRDNRWTVEGYAKYGRGIRVALDEHRKLIGIMDKLRKVRGFEVIVVAHAGVTDFKNPQGEDYMRFKPSIDGDTAPELYKQWCDSVLFMNWETEVKKGEGFKRNKGVSTGNRVLYLRRDAAFDAGNRWGLEDEIEIPGDDPTAAYRLYAEARKASGRYLVKGKA